MCTILNMKGKGHCFGRNLDLEESYGEQVCILLRKFPLTFRGTGEQERRYAMVGMAVRAEGYPLFYDGTNEKGLCMAGLHFPENACYHPAVPGKENVTPYEFIPWVLGRWASVKEAREGLKNVNLLGVPFSDAIPLAPLHWAIADGEGCLVVESTADGLHVYENPAGVLTNNPPFPWQAFRLNDLRGLGTGTPENTFLPEVDLEVYCQGLGGLGLPGDMSSTSRFLRGAFHLAHSRSGDRETDRVGQCFHLLDTVAMPLGSCRVDEDTWDRTVYSACMSSGRYYYTTYGNRRVRCVDLGKADLDGSALLVFPVEGEEDIFYQNGGQSGA